MTLDLYPKSRSAKLDLELFLHPPAEYRGTPFWSWNNKLDPEQLFRQIRYFKEMGFGGFHMHARTGLDTLYLGPDFMSAVRACAEQAQANQMLAWLYDEDRWPSGFAGGLVTRDPQYRAKHLLFTSIPYNGSPVQPLNTSAAAARRMENGVLLAYYEVVLENGWLARYRRLAEGEQGSLHGKLWYAYLETARETPWFNNQTYVDTLSKAAIRQFTAVTHERYAAAVGQHFGAVVPAIFTDEPQVSHKQCFQHADETRDLFIPFTTDFLTTYERAYGQRLEDHLPELFWDLPHGAASVVRYRYHDHVCERFTEAFADTLGDWCSQHGLALTGHVMEEFTLQGQTVALGEAMRSYRSFHIPGIDMLCDAHEYTTAKQAQSAAHQYGRCGVTSELYGVTNWDFSFVGHKAQGDWQAALGVTVRVPHLAWVSMAGEAKRDYPASISYQSPWYREYCLIEDHFSRLNTVLTRGRPHVRVGVVHPIESYWLCFGPREQTQPEREEREQNFQNLTQWLLFGLIDFDFISEALLPSLCPEPEGARLIVGQMRYDAVVVPALRTIRSTTLERLEHFAAEGGAVIFAGEIPTLVDAQPSDRARKLARHCATIDLMHRQVLQALAPYRDVEGRLADGGLADALLHQIRIDGDERYLFLCNTDRTHPREDTRIKLKGSWSVTQMDTLTGQCQPLASRREGEDTVLGWDFSPHGSLLLRLEPGWRAGGIRVVTQHWSDWAELDDPVPVTLSEPNVLLLDQAAWQLNDEPWQAREEILRLDNLARSQLGLAERGGNIAQPWSDTEPPAALGQLSLKFVVQSDIALERPLLALEEAEQVRIRVDGEHVPSHVAGWWVDEAIQQVPLPSLSAGFHEILLTLPYTRKTNVEWCYLLGDFGVEVKGRHARIVAPVRSLAWGDWTTQGLPFYAGNITYHVTVAGPERNTALEAPQFKAPLLAMALDGKPAGKIAFAPFRVELGKLAKGTHTLDLTAYGNRINTFGPLHNTDAETIWFGPPAWRTTGRAWAYEYQLKPMGILVAPTLQVTSER